MQAILIIVYICLMVITFTLIVMIAHIHHLSIPPIHQRLLLNNKFFLFIIVAESTWGKLVIFIFSSHYFFQNQSHYLMWLAPTNSSHSGTLLIILSNLQWFHKTGKRCRPLQADHISSAYKATASRSLLQRSHVSLHRSRKDFWISRVPQMEGYS